MAWISLILAGLFEVIGVTGMNLVIKKKTPKAYAILIFGFVCSFLLLNFSMTRLPVGLSYAVWTGIGTVGGTSVGMLFYHESKDWKRMFFLCLIIVSIIGLKLTV